MLVASDALSARAGKRAVRVALALCAGVALWANLHAGAFVAPLALACAAAGARLDRNGAGRRPALAALGAAAALFATPIGFGLLRSCAFTWCLPALSPDSTNFARPRRCPIRSLSAYAAAFAVSAGLAWRRRPLWTHALPLLPFALLAARSVRFGADAALVAAPLLAVSLTSIAARLRARWPRLFEPSDPHGGRGGAARRYRPRPAARRPRGGEMDAGELPLSAIAFVDAHGLRERMYNDFEIGSYLLFEPAGGYPRHRVFVDPRLPAYPPEFHRLLGRDDLSRDEWSAAMDGYGVETALLAYAGVNRRVAWWDPERYALVFREANARVFVRRLPRYAALIAEREIPATFSSAWYRETTLPSAARARQPVPGCEWQRRLGDLAFEIHRVPSRSMVDAYERALAAPAGCLRAADEVRVAGLLGGLALAEGRAADALPLFDRALARGDTDLATFTNRAIALEGLGRNADAAAAWDAVIARAGDSPLAARARARRARLLGK